MFCLTNPAQAQLMGQRGQASVIANRGALGKCLDYIEKMARKHL